MFGLIESWLKRTTGNLNIRVLAIAQSNARKSCFALLILTPRNKFDSFGKGDVSSNWKADANNYTLIQNLLAQHRQCVITYYK